MGTSLLSWLRDVDSRWLWPGDGRALTALLSGSETRSFEFVKAASSEGEAPVMDGFLGEVVE